MGQREVLMARVMAEGMEGKEGRMDARSRAGVAAEGQVARPEVDWFGGGGKGSREEPRMNPGF